MKNSNTHHYSIYKFIIVLLSLIFCLNVADAKSGKGKNGDGGYHDFYGPLAASQPNGFTLDRVESVIARAESVKADVEMRGIGTDFEMMSKWASAMNKLERAKSYLDMGDEHKAYEKAVNALRKFNKIVRKLDGLPEIKDDEDDDYDDMDD